MLIMRLTLVILALSAGRTDYTKGEADTIVFQRSCNTHQDPEKRPVEVVPDTLVNNVCLLADNLYAPCTCSQYAVRHVDCIFRGIGKMYYGCWSKKICCLFSSNDHILIQQHEALASFGFLAIRIQMHKMVNLRNEYIDSVLDLIYLRFQAEEVLRLGDFANQFEAVSALHNFFNAYEIAKCSAREQFLMDSNSAIRDPTSAYFPSTAPSCTPPEAAAPFAKEFEHMQREKAEKASHQPAAPPSAASSLRQLVVFLLDGSDDDDTPI
ncbi:hypothetical protein B0H16DRAFT_1745629 [Mycena metata]|uniref:Uncharacterized protein n=1 Tax=Mycena metata TaxID=1033252 RepID=A0AAD7H273_9AGAR|nr:hypothetical protein B0H16DRAFT_1745629 [Mycena metata]